MHASIGAMITINGGVEKMLEGATTDVVGITSLQMGVFGGIIVGLGVAALHNKFYKIELPQVLSFLWRNKICSNYLFISLHISWLFNVLYLAGYPERNLLCWRFST